MKVREIAATVNEIRQMIIEIVRQGQENLPSAIFMLFMGLAFLGILYWKGLAQSHNKNPMTRICLYLVRFMIVSSGTATGLTLLNVMF
jgi:hypothetical protein